MTTRPPVRPLSLSVLVLGAAVLGYLSGLPDEVGVVVAVGGVAVSAFLRFGAPGYLTWGTPVPALLGLAIVAVGSPSGLGIDLVAGLVGLAYLVWLADDPERPAGGAARSLPTVAVPGLALAIAWTSALFVPAGSVPLGVAGALLALTLAAVALLVGRPFLFDREGA